MQGPDRKLPPAIVLDTSLVDGIDQVLALAMLLAFDAQREARLASVSLSHNSLQVAAFCELLVRFYRGEQPGEAAGRNAVTVGMSERGNVSTTLPPMISKVLERVTADGRPLYPRTIEKLNDTADPVAVIRNALTAQQDQNATFVLAGDPVNLLGLLDLPEGKALVQKKVRLLSISSPGGSQPAIDRLIADWPSPIVQAGNQMNVAYPGVSIDEDFKWTPNHPVVDAYRSAGKMPYDAPAQAMVALLYAIHPDDNYFILSQTTRSDRRILAEDSAQTDRIAQMFRQAVSARPAGRRGGRGGA